MERDFLLHLEWSVCILNSDITLWDTSKFTYTWIITTTTTKYKHMHSIQYS